MSMNLPPCADCRRVVLCNGCDACCDCEGCHCEDETYGCIWEKLGEEAA